MGAGLPAKGLVAMRKSEPRPATGVKLKLGPALLQNGHSVEELVRRRVPLLGGRGELFSQLESRALLPRNVAADVRRPHLWVGVSGSLTLNTPNCEQPYIPYSSRNPKDSDKTKDQRFSVTNQNGASNQAQKPGERM